MKKILILVISIALLSPGCTLMAPKVKTIYVPPRTPFILRQDVPNIDVWTMDSEGIPRDSNIDLEEGWF